jgi:anti-sigma factor RsiW
MDKKDMETGLDDATFAKVMLYVDGELDGTERQEVEALLQRDVVARAVADDWKLAKVALREAIEHQEVKADLSMVRGRVMTKLPADPRPAHVPEREQQGLFAWLRGRGIGKVGLAAAAAVALAAWLILSTGGLGSKGAEGAAGAMAQAPGEPAPVVIEEMEIESGTIVVDPGEGQGGTTVIWHFDNAGGAG